MKKLIAVLLLVILIGGAGLYYITKGGQWKFSDSMVEIPTTLEPYDLYDIGVAKIDLDDRLDIFTVNHSSRQQVLSGNAQSMFMSDLGMEQVHGFPGAAAKALTPEISKAGLHIFRKDKNLHIVTSNLNTLSLNEATQITLELPWPMKVLSSRNATVSLSEKEPDASAMPSEAIAPTSLLNVSVANIELEDDAEIVITGEQDILELPHTISVANETLRNNTYVGGSDMLSLELPAVMAWRDRHGMAWRDMDDDRDSDVYISRGGVKGQLAQVPSNIKDEFFLRQGNEATDIIERAGMIKNSCPARQTAWTDANADGLLDIHISCGRVGFSDRHPDQLYVENDGAYEDVAADVGVAYAGVSVFKWVDIDVDGDLDLITAQSQTLLLFTNEGGSFSKTVLSSELSAKPTQILIADLDHDADLDVFTVQRSGSLVVLNTDNSFTVQAPETLGLPSRLRAASVVDVDNDGYIDMHMVPGGIYRATSAGQYAPSDLLSDTTDIGSINEARCVWVDQDMNGLLDPMCAVRLVPHKLVRVWKKMVEKKNDTRFWVTHAASNRLPAKNWLQLDLRAGPLNVEGIGAVVTLVANGRTRIASVGQSDTAHYSQGHYRLYFGLGDSTEIESLQVQWPGGEQESYEIAQVNTLVTLKQSLTANQ